MDWLNDGEAIWLQMMGKKTVVVTDNQVRASDFLENTIRTAIMFSHECASSRDRVCILVPIFFIHLAHDRFTC